MSKLLELATALCMMSAVAPAHAGGADPWTVKKFEPILTSIGERQIVAFYEPEGVDCLLFASVKKNIVAPPESVVRLRVALGPHQRIQIEGTDRKSLILECGENAAILTVIEGSNATS